VEVRDQQEEDSDVVAEAVLAGEYVEKLAAEQTLILLAAAQAILTRFTEDFLVRNSPGDRSNWQGDEKQIRNLVEKVHHQLDARNTIRRSSDRPYSRDRRTVRGAKAREKRGTLA